MNNWQLASIDTLGNGKAKDKLNFAIQEAVDNCLDINRDYKKTRKVTLEITLAPPRPDSRRCQPTTGGRFFERKLK